MIDLQDVSKHYRGPDGATVLALDRVRLSVATGTTLALIGPSGCGKTTTMKLINGLEQPTSGRVLVGGQDLAGWDPIRLRRSIGYVIQSGGLFPHLTVQRNLTLLPELEGWSRARAQARAQELLALVNLAPSDFSSRYPRQLSGGQRQRVGVARALALDPPYILMDEPFGALDPVTKAQLHSEFLELKRRVGKTIVLVTHDLPEAFKLADRLALMSEGRLVQVGTQQQLQHSPSNPVVASFLAGGVAALRPASGELGAARQRGQPPSSELGSDRADVEKKS